MTTEPPSKCPFPHPVAIDRATMPERIAKLPVLRGFPVPFFVAKVDGEYDFRVIDPDKMARCVNERLCWVCGEKMGAYMSFVIGPMCGVNHTSAEPPSHRECAQYSAKHCPFLTRPNMKRREDDFTRECAENVAGVGLTRNPGACAVWTVKRYGIFGDGKGGVLFNIGEPRSVEWYAMGREAMRAEVQESIDSGIHFLRDACDTEKSETEKKSAHRELDRRLLELQKHLPA